MSDLTEEQAYAAMFRFLDQLYDSTKSDDLGSLLGGMTILPDGSTADEAVAHDWAKAVNYVLSGGRVGLMEIK